MARIGKYVSCALLVVCSMPLLAQQSGPAAKVARLLNRSLGEIIVERALETNAWDYYGSDCSHFVNAIFEAAGMPFPYANSIELYNGNDIFHRVFHPQPGDLIVWRGHVGIVVDPGEHSFYSMLRNGLRLSNYDSGYWKSRGRARFLRRTAPLTPAAGAVRVARLHTEGRYR